MKDVLIKFLILFLLAASAICHSQDMSNYEITLEVNQVFAPLSVTVQTLRDGKTIEDLNPYYKSSWVKEFESVEITSMINGVANKAVSKNDRLTQEQQEIMKQADFGSEISVVVTYLPDNTLKNNDIKEYDFTFVVNPDDKAKYPGGERQLADYLTENAMDKIPENSFQEHNVMAIQFTIDEKGQVVEAHVPSAVENLQEQNKEAMDLLLRTVCTMPTWRPAEYRDGSKAKQEFVLTAGDHRSCTLNLLNVRRDTE